MFPFKTAVLLLLLSLMSCVDPGRTARPAGETNRMVNGSKDSYLIDGKSVVKADFDKFLSSLKEKTGTWFCAEMNDGGETGYDAVDKSGAVYQVRLRSSSGKARNSISRKDGDSPVK
jgi:hypothetical protein